MANDCLFGKRALQIEICKYQRKGVKYTNMSRHTSQEIVNFCHLLQYIIQSVQKTPKVSPYFCYTSAVL